MAKKLLGAATLPPAHQRPAPDRGGVIFLRGVLLDPIEGVCVWGLYVWVGLVTLRLDKRQGQQVYC